MKLAVLTSEARPRPKAINKLCDFGTVTGSKYESLPDNRYASPLSLYLQGVSAVVDDDVRVVA